MVLRLAMLVALLLAAPAAAQAAPGDLDRSFAGDGATVLPSRGISFAIGAQLRPDGRLVVAQSADLLQLSASGRLDRAFRAAAAAFYFLRVEAGPLVDGAGRTRVVAYAGGEAPGLALARALPSGAPDLAFGPEGSRRLATPPGQFFQVQAITDARGRFVLCGSYADAGVTRSYVSRFSDDGELDRGFGFGGVLRGVRDSRASAVVTRSGGGLEYTEYRAFPGKRRGGSTARRTVRDDGSLVREVPVSDRPPVRRRARLRDLRPVATDRRGRSILIGARGRDGRVPVGRLRPGGRVDRRFGDRGLARVPFGRRRGLRVVGGSIARVLVRPNGRILLAGTVDEYGETELDERPYLALTQLEG